MAELAGTGTSWLDTANSWASGLGTLTGNVVNTITKTQTALAGTPVTQAAPQGGLQPTPYVAGPAATGALPEELSASGTGFWARTAEKFGLPVWSVITIAGSLALLAVALLWKLFKR